MRIQSLTVACFATVLLMACGGGGGSNSGGGASGVTFQVTSPASIDSEIYEGQRVPTINISGAISSGDVNALSGKTLYVIAEFPDAALFEPPSFTLNSNLMGGNLSMFGKLATAGVRTYSGIIHIRACLDAACLTELTVANHDVPYSIKVKQGVSLAQDSVVLTTPFGTMPQPVHVAVTLPQDTVGWSLRDAGGFADFYNRMVRPDKAPDGSPEIIISADRLALPGDSFTTPIFVEATVAGGQTLGRTMSATYTTLASSETFALERPVLAFRVVQSTQVWVQDLEGGVLFPDLSSDRLDYLGTSYEWPANVGGIAIAPVNWLWRDAPLTTTVALNPSRKYAVTNKAQICDPSGITCLPLGHYVATVHYRYRPLAGAAVNIDQPVTLDFVP